MAGFFFADQQADPLSPQAVDRKRALIDALWKDSLSTEPVKHWTQGAARMMNALANRLQEDRLDKAEAAGIKKFNEDGASILSGQIGSASPASPATWSPSVSAGSPAAAAPPKSEIVDGSEQFDGGTAPAFKSMQPFRQAIAAIESKGSGDYAAMGPTTNSGDRAYGKYQVMGANIPSWTQAALGRSMSPQEFLANPQAQDAVFDHRFGGYIQKYGNPYDAASAWFTGRPQSQGGNSKDVLGTSGNGYVQKFANALMRNAPGAMAYAPGGGDGWSPAQADTGAPLEPQKPQLPPMIANPGAGNAMPNAPAPMAFAPTPAQPDQQKIAAALQQGAAPASAPAPDNARLIAALNNPWAARSPMMSGILQKVMADRLTGDGVSYQTTPDGSIIALDKKGRVAPRVVYQGPANESWSVLKDNDQNPVGMINSKTGAIKPIDTAALGGGAGFGPKGSDVVELRKEVQSLPSYKNFAQAAPIYRGMVDAAGRDTKAADLNMVYGLGKIMDPTSVVREGEMVMVRNTASIPDWLAGAINTLNGGGQLTAQTRKQIMQEAYGRLNAYRDQFGVDAEHYKGIATRKRMNVDDVLPNFGDFKPWEPAQKTVGKQTMPKDQATPTKGAVPVRVNSPAEAAKLPRGTPIILPDGSQGWAQ